MSTSCILCKTTNIKTLQSIQKAALIELYKKEFGFDVSKELTELDTIKYYQCKKCHLRYFDTEAAGRGQFYEDLQNHRTVYYSSDRVEFNYAKQFISDLDKVLEIGSGNGHFATILNKQDYIGLEFNDLAIEDAKTKGITLIKQSVEDYALSTTEKFDVVCSFHVLEHVTSPVDFIEASLKLLKPNGKLIIAVPCCNSPLTDNPNHVLNLPPHHISRWTVESLSTLETQFDIKLLEYKVDFINNYCNENDYYIQALTNKLVNTFYPKKRALINSVLLYRINKLSKLLVTKVGLKHLMKNNSKMGHNMTFVFEKQ